MATKKEQVNPESGPGKYRSCVITPMTSNGDGKPLVKKVHVVDATIVAGIVFFSLLIGASVPGLLSGNFDYISVGQMVNRLTTAVLAFGLTFMAQWARYRGIQFIQFLGRNKDK